MGILADPTPNLLAMSRFDDGAINMQGFIRRLAEQVANAIKDSEADQLCVGGANSRNGHRKRSLATCVGALTLRIPKLRTGSFFPDDVIERCQRVDRALVAAAASPASSSSSPTPTPGSSAPSARSSRAPRGSAAVCTSCATACARRAPRG